MSGAAVKAQVEEQMIRTKGLAQEIGALNVVHDLGNAVAALAPCVVLTREEAEQVRKLCRGDYYDEAEMRELVVASVALLTPEERDAD